MRALEESILCCAGSILVRFYGERSLMWAKESDLEEGALTPRHIADLQAWGRTRQKCAPLQVAAPSALWPSKRRAGQQGVSESLESP